MSFPFSSGSSLPPSAMVFRVNGPGVSVGSGGAIARSTEAIRASGNHSGVPISSSSPGNGSEVQLHDRSVALEPAQITLHEAARDGRAEAIRALIESGVDVNAQDGGGRTALHNAAIGGHVGAMYELIVGRAVVNAVSGERRTPLHEAVRGGHVEAIRVLVVLGANVDVIDMHGNTALYEAAMNGHAEAVSVLVAGGASNLVMGTRRLSEVSHCSFDLIWKLLCLAEYEQIFVFSPYYINVRVEDCNGDTLLHRAYREGNCMAIERLLSLGADPKSRNAAGLMPKDVCPADFLLDLQ